MKSKWKKCRGIITLCIICILASLIQVETKAQDRESQNLDGYNPNDFIIQIAKNCSEPERQVLFQENGIQVKDVCEDYYLVRLKKNFSLKEVMPTLKSSTYVIQVKPNYEYKATNFQEGVDTVGTISFSKNQWALRNDGTLKFIDSIAHSYVPSSKGMDTNIGPLWNETEKMKGKQVIVAVLDSGIDLEQESLKGRLWKNTKEIKGNGIDDDHNGYTDDYDGFNTFATNRNVTDEVGHGTHCTGIIVANGEKNVWGITGRSNVLVMPVKIFSDLDPKGETYATSFSIASGINYAQKNGADICNMSLGMRSSDSVLKGVIEKSKLLMVCAAGNEGKRLEDKPFYPACYRSPNVISVGNIRCDGKLHRTSNYSKSMVDVVAPGTSIYSCLPNDKYGFKTGTSMATPYVSGTAAMIYSYTDKVTAAYVREQICEGSRKVDNLSDKIHYGVLDSYRAFHTDVETPKINTSNIMYRSRGYTSIKLNVVDYGIAGLQMVKWQKGLKSVADFSKGEKGTRVYSKGAIKVTSSGYYTIYAMDKEKNEVIKRVKVTVAAPTSFKLNRSSITLRKGHPYTLKKTSSPSGVYVKYSYYSSNKNIATISSTGKIVGKRAGIVTIVVKTQNKLRRTCKVRII